MTWNAVCQLDDIPKNAGVAALIGDQQVALFRVGEQIFAVDNYDPIGHANVLSRGIVCSIGERLCVASPLYKQHFDLATGECVEEETTIKTFATRIAGSTIEVDCNTCKSAAA